MKFDRPRVLDDCILAMALVLGFVLLACSPTADAPAAIQDAQGVPAAVGSSPAPPEPEPVASPVASPVALDPADYKISVIPSLLSDGTVKLKIETNIPGVIEVMADISLSGQKPNDVWIGKNQRVRIKGGQGEVTFVTSDLPKGRYESEVSFYPRWGFQDAASRATGIDRQIDATASLGSLGSGMTANEAQFRENGQKWVMMNVNPNQAWDAAKFTNRFGTFSELEVQGLNPSVIKAYYFPRIDTTIFVNALRGEISHWRLGQAHR